MHHGRPPLEVLVIPPIGIQLDPLYDSNGGPWFKGLSKKGEGYVTRCNKNSLHLVPSHDFSTSDPPGLKLGSEWPLRSPTDTYRRPNHPRCPSPLRHPPPPEEGEEDDGFGDFASAPTRPLAMQLPAHTLSPQRGHGPFSSSPRRFTAVRIPPS